MGSRANNECRDAGGRATLLPLSCRRAAGCFRPGNTTRTAIAYDPNRNNVLFARIVLGKLPSRKVYEDEHVLSFHDTQFRGALQKAE